MCSKISFFKPNLMRLSTALLTILKVYKHSSQFQGKIWAINSLSIEYGGENNIDAYNFP